jgi:lipid A ethanolaminephosphotransferase
MPITSPPTSDARENRCGWNPLTLAVLTAVWIAALPNWPLWRAMLELPEIASLRGALFLAGFALMIASFLSAFLACFAWRLTIKPAIAVLLIVAALGAHFMGSYGAVIDTTMMVNVLQTDRHEVSDLLSLRLAGSVVAMAIVPLLLIWRLPVQHNGWTRQLGRNVVGVFAALLLLSLLIFGLFADLSATMRNHKSIRYLINPVNSLYALVDMTVGSGARPSGPPRAIGTDAKIIARVPGAKPPLLLLVVGETARADHFSMNGYARPTNPELSALDLVSYSDVTSCGTNTAASLPCMFSSLGKKGFESLKFDQENLLDLVQRAGMAVLWVDNQAGCKGLCDRVAHAQAGDAPSGTTQASITICSGDGIESATLQRRQLGEAGATTSAPALVRSEVDDRDCLDDALLTGLEARLEALPEAARERGVLIVLHQMGSHGPAYFKRSPPDRKPFQPECLTINLQQCERGALINAYDNSIAYSDHMLAGSVRWLQEQAAFYDTSMFYVSDHGESLGENGIYLHGLPYSIAPREQTHVPMVVWLAPRTQADSGPSMACLRAHRDTPLSHDNLFHSALGLLGIRASEYRPELDAFATCRKP